MNIFLLIIPLFSAIVAQSLKMCIKSNKVNFALRNITTYSGMPSGHSAAVVSLFTIIGLSQGFSSPLFAISFVFAAIVMSDALGFRNYLGQHGKTLNVLVSDLKNDEVLEHRYPHLLEKIGHTPLQVLAGAGLGLVISLIGYYLFF